MRLEEIARAKALDCDTIEIWFADEARIGQKNKITRRWAKRGTRPSAPRDQRTASTYIFGAVCPKRGTGAALILPACNTEAMNLHLAEIAAAVAPAAHAVLLVDQAGWHMSTRLVVPANITIIALPPKCPELNPVENVWQFMRDNWLSNRIFKSYDDLVDHCCEAWNKLVDQPWRIMCANGRTSSDQWDSVLVQNPVAAELIEGTERMKARTYSPLIVWGRASRMSDWRNLPCRSEMCPPIFTR
jgi:putative transposase